jgi:hypothetical protein
VFPLFPLGQIMAPPGAIAALERAKQSAACFLARHATGDWGELEPSDVARMTTAWFTGFASKQLRERRGREVLDNHRGRPVGNYSSVARGVLTNCHESDHW